MPSKEYYQKHKEQYAKYNKEKRETCKEYWKERYENKKEELNEYQKKYRQTEEGIKIGRITNWKRRGVKSDDYSSLYDKYINCKNCERCNVELIEGKGRTNHKHLDHDHDTGLFRNVLCGYCNSNILKNK